MELLIVYYALNSGRQNYTSCYCQLCSPHLSVFIFPFRTLKSTQVRRSSEATGLQDVQRQNYLVFRLAIDVYILEQKRMLVFKITLPICTGQVLTYGKTEGASMGPIPCRIRTSTKFGGWQKRRLKMVVRQYQKSSLG